MAGDMQEIIIWITKESMFNLLLKGARNAIEDFMDIEQLLRNKNKKSE